eukprot:TRINITY_DN32478_c0_g1_i1.p1 TRINITY_DN32478_c0_g1~~TRINITY_DN32478_c0_g1_i1.p1  ORF type:complete len:621 (+),score=108.32 TRINITY_DN32478_c0_g1_i1:26-1864(+)
MLRILPQTMLAAHSAAGQSIEACANLARGDPCSWTGPSSSVRHGRCAEVGPASRSVVACLAEAVGATAADPTCRRGLTHSRKRVCCPLRCAACLDVGGTQNAGSGLSSAVGVEEACRADVILRVGPPCTEAAAPCVLAATQGSLPKPSRYAQDNKDGKSAAAASTVSKDSRPSGVMAPAAPAGDSNPAPAPGLKVDEVVVPLVVGAFAGISMLCCFFVGLLLLRRGRRLQGEDDTSVASDGEEAEEAKEVKKFAAKPRDAALSRGSTLSSYASKSLLSSMRSSAVPPPSSPHDSASTVCSQGLPSSSAAGLRRKKRPSPKADFDCGSIERTPAETVTGEEILRSHGAGSLVTQGEQLMSKAKKGKSTRQPVRKKMSEASGDCGSRRRGTRQQPPQLPQMGQQPQPVHEENEVQCPLPPIQSNSPQTLAPESAPQRSSQSEVEKSTTEYTDGLQRLLHSHQDVGDMRSDTLSEQHVNASFAFAGTTATGATVEATGSTATACIAPRSLPPPPEGGAGSGKWDVLEQDLSISLGEDSHSSIRIPSTASPSPVPTIACASRVDAAAALGASQQAFIACSALQSQSSVSSAATPSMVPRVLVALPSPPMPVPAPVN